MGDSDLVSPLTGQGNPALDLVVKSVVLKNGLIAPSLISCYCAAIYKGYIVHNMCPA
jgi:hypothetical protein